MIESSKPWPLYGFLICTVPLLAGAWFAFRPSERLLSVMRPLTLGAIFPALCSFVLAIANGCIALSMMNALDCQDSVLWERFFPKAWRRWWPLSHALRSPGSWWRLE